MSSWVCWIFEGVVGRVTGPFFLPSTVSERRVFLDKCKFGAVFKLILEICMHKRFFQKSLRRLWSWMGLSGELNWPCQAVPTVRILLREEME